MYFRLILPVFATLTVITVASCSAAAPSGNNAATSRSVVLDKISTTPAPTSTKPPGSGKFIAKKIGETAGLGCKAQQKNCVDIMDFTVSDISAAQGCSEEPGSGKAFLHVAASASTSESMPENVRQIAGTLLNTQYWQVIGSDGFTSTNLPIATSCTYTPGPFYDTMGQGVKQRGDIVFVVPKESVRLVLTNGTESGWEWQIPSL